MLLMPTPRAGDDVVEFGETRLPAEFAFGFIGGGDESGRVAGAAGLFDGGDFLAGNFLARGDDFAHGVAVAITEVVETGLARRETKHVRLREIGYMDVVADARAVRRGIIRAENLDVRFLAERDGEDVGDEMRFDAVMFTELFARAGGVEVTERDKIESVNLLIPREDFFEHQLGLAVGIDGTLRQIFRHRNFIRRPVSGASGAEDEFFYTASDGGIGELESVDDVVVKIFLRIRHRFADERVCGEVQDGVGRSGLNGGADVAFKFGLGEDELRARIDSGAVALGEIVVNRDLMAGVEKFFGAD